MWVEVTEPQLSHNCETPSANEVAARQAGEDSLWDCDTCCQQWLLNSVSPDGSVMWVQEPQARMSGATHTVHLSSLDES